MELYKLLNINKSVLQFQNYNNINHTFEVKYNENFNFDIDSVYKLEFNDNNELVEAEIAYVYRIIPTQEIVSKSRNTNLNIAFEDSFKTPYFNTLEEAQQHLKDSFINSSCNILHSIKTSILNDKFSLEAKVGVYYLNEYCLDLKLSAKFDNIFIETLKIIKDNFFEEFKSARKKSLFTSFIKYMKFKFSKIKL